MSALSDIVVYIIILFVRIYQACVSPFFPPRCRFQPTCSHYAVGALQEFGLFRGLYLSIRRLLRCHPFHPGGYDPVK